MTAPRASIPALALLAWASAQCAGRVPLYRASRDAFALRLPPRARLALRAPPGATSRERFEVLRAAFAQALAREHVPGGALAIVEHGARTFAAGLGARGHGQSAPMTESTRLRIGSIHKTLLALAVLRAVEAGRLSLDTRATELVPWFTRGPGYDAHAVTLRMLLQHSAGLPDFGGGPEVRAPESLRAYFTAHGSDPLWTPPGRLYNYSNANYALAAAVLEAREGRPLREVLRDEVLRPAGLTSATYDPEELERGEHTTGYLAGLDFGPGPEADRLTAAGGVAMDIRDLARLGEVLLHEGAPLVSAETFARMRSESMPTGQRFGLRYGLGLMLAHARGRDVLFHAGSIYGENSLLLTVPAEGFAVALYANATFNPGELGRAALELFLGERPEEPEAPERPLERYVGDYADPTGALGRLRVGRAGDTLWLELLGGQPRALPGELGGVFHFDALGNPEYFVTRLGVARRVAAN